MRNCRAKQALGTLLYEAYSAGGGSIVSHEGMEARNWEGRAEQERGRYESLSASERGGPGSRRGAAEEEGQQDRLGVRGLDQSSAVRFLLPSF